MKPLLIFLWLVSVSFLFSCVKEKDLLEEQPVMEVVLPFPCDTLYFGEAFQLKVQLNDNIGLGNAKMDVHNNFNHHKHGEHEACYFDEPRDPVNPYLQEWIFNLDENKKAFVLDTLIVIPDSVVFDTGDYHFHLYVTDSDGYQSFTTMDVKILERE